MERSNLLSPPARAPTKEQQEMGSAPELWKVADKQEPFVSRSPRVHSSVVSQDVLLSPSLALLPWPGLPLTV